MLGAVIRNGNNTLVVDLPTGMMDLQTKLNSIGIQETSDKIKLSDEDGDPVRVKLYATEPEEIHLLSLLAPNRTLADANSSVEMLHRANQNFQMRLKCSLLANGYRTLDEFFNDIRCNDTQYDVIEICGQQALYSDLRLSAADIPLGLYLYHLRESDHGNPLRFVSLENDVLLNHGGSVITMHPIDLGPNVCVDFTEDTEPTFSGDRMTAEDLMLAENTEDEGMGGMNL